MALRLSRRSLTALCGALGVMAWVGIVRSPLLRRGHDQVIVTMTDNRFVPQTVNLYPGQTVTWRNTSRLDQSVTSETFDSGRLAPGERFSHRFLDPGIFDYYSEPRQGVGMVGRVIVDRR